MPACRRTRLTRDPDEEWLCGRHFRLASYAARVEYITAWNEADKCDRRRMDGLDVSYAPYVRVTAAWEKLKAEALKAAGVSA